jgi:site-specific DNA-methyltransferase (adenine-specific)
MSDINLMRGDCLEMMEQIPDGSVDLTVTSPPYDNLRTYNGNNTQWGEHVWKGVLENLYIKTNLGGVVVWIVGDATVKGSETGTSFKQALYAKEIGFNLHDTMIWEKPNPMPLTHNRYEQSFEYMFVWSKGKPSRWNAISVESLHKGKKRSGTFQHNGDGIRKPKHKGGNVSGLKQQKNIWTIANNSRTEHPAPFPLQLAKDHIISWSNEGDVVLDPFMGSGTTGVAAKNTNRNFIGIELDETYFNIAKERIEKTNPIDKFFGEE